MAFAAKALELQLADSQKACLSVAQKSSSLRPCFGRPWLSFARRMKPSARNMARRQRTYRDSSSDREDLQQAGAGCWTLRLVNASLQVPHASGTCNTCPPFSLATLADEPAYSLGRCLCLLPGSAASGPCREVILSAAQNFHVSVWYLYYSLLTGGTRSLGFGGAALRLRRPRNVRCSRTPAFCPSPWNPEVTGDCGLADPRLTVGADFAEENLQATHIELTHVQAASLRIWSCRGVGVSERGGSFRLGACACGSFLSCRTLAHGKRVFVTKAKLLGTGVLPLHELKVPACKQESGHLHKQTLDLSWMPALGSRVLELAAS